MSRILKDYSLSITLAALFLLAWTVQTWTGWVMYSAEQQAHGDPPTLFGQSGYVWHWAEATFENWQSEFLQLLTFVVLTAFLVHKGSHESRDTDDQMKAQLDRIEEKLKALEKGGAKKG